MTGMPMRRSTSRAAATLRSPICTEPGVMSWANMLAPPASLATRRRGSAPSAVSCSTRSGTAVSGNLARLVTSRARLFDGRRIWAIAPALPSVSSSRARSAIDPLARLFQDETLARRAEQRLDLAQQQNATGRERLDEEREEALLHRPVERDHDVAAHD